MTTTTTSPAMRVSTSAAYRSPKASIAELAERLTGFEDTLIYVAVIPAGQKLGREAARMLGLEGVRVRPETAALMVEAMGSLELLRMGQPAGAPA